MSRRPEIPTELRTRFEARVRLLWVGRGGSLEASDPVVNETLGRVVEAMMNRQIQDLDSVPSFVYRTARQVCDESAAILHDRTHGDGDPHAVLAGKQGLAHVSRALLRLAESDRVLLDAYYCKCLPAHGIALNLGLGPGAVRRRKNHVMRQLRDAADGSPRAAELVPELIDS